MGLDRRSFLRLTAAAGAGAAASQVLTGAAFAEGLGLDPRAVFQYGVASGDPLPDGLLLWTRVTPTPRSAPGSGRGGRVPVEWEVATDPAMRAVVQRGRTTTDAGVDHTVKVDVRGLAPATTYWYRFRALGQVSRTGRGRTAPAVDSAPARLRFALASCSNYAAGYFTAYRHLAARDDLDLVVHVGDYLYEYGDGEYGGLRPLDPAGETVRLEDYRRRHALYKADPDLQALHASAAFVTTIDDHEVTNDSWSGGAQNHDDAEGSYAVRKSAAFRAYLEWMPVRVTPLPGGDVQLYRSFRFGTLADLVMTDLRSFRDAPAQTAAELAVPRSMLGAAQKQWLVGELSRPSQWKLLGTSVQLMTVNYPVAPETRALGYLEVPTPPGSPVPSVGRNQDAWDGYPYEQAEVLAVAASAPADLVALTGDIHSTWAASLHVPAGVPGVPAGTRAGVELVTTSVTSDNVNDILGGPYLARHPVSQAFEGFIKQLNAPRIPLVELDSHGACV
ncbi:MAG TPA: alkaline phosphatase D family protein, partial [Mycobacteriales bacterium]|nr:alkaline phosphatase D family protein [Mycobacteriales bacterium]